MGVFSERDLCISGAGVEVEVAIGRQAEAARFEPPRFFRVLLRHLRHREVLRSSVPEVLRVPPDCVSFEAGPCPPDGHCTLNELKQTKWSQLMRCSVPLEAAVLLGYIELCATAGLCVNQLARCQEPTVLGAGYGPLDGHCTLNELNQTKWSVVCPSNHP